MTEHDPKKDNYKLIVNKAEKPWPNQTISGSEILQLAGSPSDWVVNQLLPGPGEDPDIAPTQKVDLDLQAEPHGVKKFLTRRPATSPG
jgi:hypothetical protein